MSSIITSILSSTVGFLFNKTRDASADKLKDGDITDAKLRDIVVRELNNVNFKLDALSKLHIEYVQKLKVLCTGICCLYWMRITTKKTTVYCILSSIDFRTPWG